MLVKGCKYRAPVVCVTLRTENTPHHFPLGNTLIPTDIERFKKSICEESVLELIAYSVNRKNFAEKEDIKNGIVSSVLQHTEHFSEF